VAIQQVFLDRLEGRLATVARDAERLRDARSNQLRVSDRRQVDEVDSARKRIEHAASHFERDARLARPASPGQRQQTRGMRCRTNQLLDIGKNRRAADEAGAGPGQAAARYRMGSPCGCLTHE
jgi:hypothetical protein